MHTAHAAWPAVSARVRELFRQGAELALLAGRSGDAEVLLGATMAGLRTPDRSVAEDPALVEAIQRVNAANLRQWAAFNMSNPGERVPPYVGPEAAEITRDLVRRGLDSRALDSYRTAQNVAWRLWMDICFGLTDDPAELRELLDISSLSISTFLDDTIDVVAARVEADLDELTRGTNAERMATVALLLEGAPIPAGRAEARLGYKLAGPHTAAVVWVSGEIEAGLPDAAADGAGGAVGAGGAGAREAGAQLEEAADRLMRAAGCERRLTLVASARSLWVWIPAAELSRESLAPALARLPDVRVAVGRPGRGVDGFRRSHLDATATQRVLARITSHERFATYSDVQLVALLTADLARADEFVADTLGPLAVSEPEIRETVAEYIRAHFNATRTAERLYTHRNTVLRRLERADQLLPRPLAENVTNVAAALEVVRLRPARG